ATAAGQIDEVEAITQATGLPHLGYAAGTLAGARGEDVDALLQHAVRNAVARGEGSALGGLARMTALQQNAHGRYEEALAAARRGCEHEDVMTYGWTLAELIEAAVRVGRREEAAAALERLGERTRASGTEWALGVWARARALLGDEEP